MSNQANSADAKDRAVDRQRYLTIEGRPGSRKSYLAGNEMKETY